MRRLGGTLIAASLLLTGCFGGDEEAAAPTSSAPPASPSASAEPSPSPDPTSASPTPTEEPVVHTSLDDLDVMEIPEDCLERGGQRLERGQLRDPESHANASWNREFEPVPVDADGDGVDELIAAFYCDGGGVAWPDQVVLVGVGGKLLDNALITKAYGEGADRGSIREFAADGEAVKLLIHLMIDASREIGEIPTTVTAADGKLHFEFEKPVDEFADAKLSLNGYGPVGLTLPGQTLVDKGWAEEHTYSEHCVYVEPSSELQAKGIWFAIEGGLAGGGELWELWAEQPGPTTPSGIQVGSTVEELKAAYGDKLTENRDPTPTSSRSTVGR